MKRSWILRAGGGAILFLMLAGPTPGNIGGCGSTTSVVQAPQHCTDREFWICTRDEHAGRIDQAGLDQCLVQIEPMCQGATWPAGCSPTQDQHDACILLLRNADLAHLTFEQLQSMYDDCNLCQ